MAPLAAYRVLGLPMTELAGQFVDLDEVLGTTGRRWGDVLRDAPNWPERCAEIDRPLLRRLTLGPTVSPEVAQAWCSLVVSGGSAPVREVARNVGWSNKHLLTKFRQQIGLGPKRAARLIRFERLLGRIDRANSPAWPELAAQSGYADQAHLIREFREFAGTSPTRFLPRRPGVST